MPSGKGAVLIERGALKRSCSHPAAIDCGVGLVPVSIHCIRNRLASWPVPRSPIAANAAPASGGRGFGHGPKSKVAYVVALRSGLGLGWMFVVAAEFMGAAEGAKFCEPEN
jgi:hypothetical protein